MTSAEITQAFIKAKGYKAKDYDDSAAFILPFIMMDVAYEYYRKEIKPLDCKHKQKVFKKRISEGYTKFNRFIFDALDADTQDALCDKMDNFRRFMYSDILSLQAKMIRCFPATLPAKDKQVVSAALLINRIARIAQDVWYSLYYVNGYRTENSGLNVVLGASRGFAKEYTKGNGDWIDRAEIYEERMNDLMEGITSFRKKCLQFVSFDKKQEEQQ